MSKSRIDFSQCDGSEQIFGSDDICHPSGEECENPLQNVRHGREQTIGCNVESGQTKKRYKSLKKDLRMTSET